MARPRYQRGFVEETGKLIKKWKAHWYVWVSDGENEDRRHRSRVIGRKPCKEDRLLSAADAALPVMTKAEAQAELDRIISIEVGGVSETRRQDGSMPFGKFLREYWLPTRESTWRKSTKITNFAVIEAHLEPRWGSTPLNQIAEPAAAAWLGELAQTYSGSMLHKIRTYLRAVITEAVELEFLPKNPLKKLKKPRAKKKIDRSFLTLEKLQALRAEMRGFRDQLILDIIMATGMRPSEFFALRWIDVLAGALYVDEGWVLGLIEEPKTRVSMAAVAVPPEIMEDLERWRKESKPASDQDWIFPSENNTPIFAENWRKRVLYPAAERAGFRCTFQMLRRTLVTLSAHNQIPIKSLQAQLRHSEVSTTLNVYAQIVSEGQREAAASMYKLMKRKKPVDTKEEE